MSWPDPEAAQPVDLTAPLPLLASFFGDHMVLQRGGKGAVVWGFIAEGSDVSVSFAGSKYAATGDAKGIWRVQLAPLPAGGPYNLTVASHNASATITDVLMGDVYIIGGQSNSEFTVSQGFNASEEIAAAANFPEIRVMTVGELTSSATPLVNFATITQVWAVASPASIGVGNWSAFTAVGWFFGRDVYQGLGADAVPLGLISDNWGGTRIELWTPAAPVQQCNDTPAGNLWNAMIYPLQVGPLALTGAVWYQGESNAGPDSIFPYACVFPAMVTSWRQGFGSNFWFGAVQLAAYASAGNGVAYIRQAQESLLALDNTALATAIDLGDSASPWGNIHPRYKQEVGARLAANALAQVYGKAVPHLSPIASGAVGGSSGPNVTVTISFEPATVVDGLEIVTPKECPYFCAGLAIQVEVDGAAKLLPASVVLGPGNTVVFTAVSPQAGLKPTVVLSGFGPWPVVSIYSRAGFPALPFNMTVTQQ